MSVSPNLIIPGFPKSGTSSLYYYLSQHEDIDSTGPKEPHVFTLKNKFNRRREIFLSLFNEERDCTYRLDASTTYMVCADAPRRIQRVVSKPKFIVVARDPIERVFSHYNWLYCNGYVEKDFIPEVREWDTSGFDPSINFDGNYKYYVEFSRYGEQIERYLDIFDRDRILVITTERLKEAPQKVLNECFDHLGLSFPKCINTAPQNVTKANELNNVPDLLSRLHSSIPNSITQRLPKDWLKSWSTRTVEPKSFGEREESFVFELLRDDVRKQRGLEIFSDRWVTTCKYL